MGKMYITSKQGQAKMNSSRGAFRKFADSCGATVHIGRSVRFDEEILDAALDALRESDAKNK